MVAGDAAPLTQLRRGVLEFCVLALLRDDERYGFEITRDLAQAESLATTEGTIYPLLARLRREQMVETTWRESTSGPPRRYYRLTAEGVAALERFIEDWRRFSAAVDAIINPKGRG